VGNEQPDGEGKEEAPLPLGRSAARRRGIAMLLLGKTRRRRIRPRWETRRTPIEPSRSARARSHGGGARAGSRGGEIHRILAGEGCRVLAGEGRRVLTGAGFRDGAAAEIWGFGDGAAAEAVLAGESRRAGDLCQRRGATAEGGRR